MKLGVTLGTTLGLALTALGATAQTWVAPRSTPVLGEIVAIDATGETGWPYGAEDVAGDGLESFKQQEQSIDIRTVYASTDASRFWVRLYVSDPHTAGGNVTAFVFVDADRSVSTGGTAAAPELDAKFTADASPGGYDYVIEIGGNGTVNDVWEWSDAQEEYQPGAPLTSDQAAGEVGEDDDPILYDPSVPTGHSHGYLQASVDLALLGLTPACQAMLYVRSVHNAAGGAGDLEVGQVGPCVPSDDNGDGVPDSVIPPTPCVHDTDCPGGGICSNGVCIVPQPCADDTDCDDDEECSDDYICMPLPGGPCTDSAQCGDLVCIDGQCRACSIGSDQCGPGRVCGRDGRCVEVGGGEVLLAGLPLTPDDVVQGGALTCGVAGSHPGDRRRRGIGAGWGFGLVGAAAVLAARARRAGRRSSVAREGADRS